MSFSELELKRIDRTVGNFCRRHSPVEHREHLRTEYRLSGHEVLIYEMRPAFREPSQWIEHGIAKMRFVRTTGE